MIDRQTGNLLFTPSVYVCRGDSLETVAALSLGESTEVGEHQKVWGSHFLGSADRGLGLA